MKTKLLTICLLLVTILSGCSQGDIYSCREVTKARMTGKWEYSKEAINKPIIFIVKGNDLYRDIGAKELRAYITPSNSTENVVIGEGTRNTNNFRWKFNTIDRIAVLNLGYRKDVYKCEKK